MEAFARRFELYLRDLGAPSAGTSSPASTSNLKSKSKSNFPRALGKKNTLKKNKRSKPNKTKKRRKTKRKHT